MTSKFLVSPLGRWWCHLLREEGPLWGRTRCILQIRKPKPERGSDKEACAPTPTQDPPGTAEGGTRSQKTHFPGAPAWNSSPGLGLAVAGTANPSHSSPPPPPLSSQMGLGFVQFGFVAIYLSESFIRGFMTAAGLQILISVLKYIFGLTIPSYAGPGSIIFVSLGAHPCRWGGAQAGTEQMLLLEEAVSSSLHDVRKQG